MAKRFIGNVKGVGVSDFSWEYYLSSSSAVLDGGSWSATPPTLGNNKYLWMRSKVTLTDGTIQYTVPVCEGVWEEIYGIYAIGDKVDGALSDVTDLKSRMTAEENKVQPINKGGTGATTAENALNALLDNKALPITKGGTGATTPAAALATLGGASIKKSWENVSPTSLFPPQDVTIAVNEGDLIGIEFESQTNAIDRRITWLTIESGMTTEIVTIQSTSDGGEIFVTRRRVKITNANSINFDKGYYRYVGDTNKRHDGYSIPTAVYIAEGVL